MTGPPRTGDNSSAFWPKAFWLYLDPRRSITNTQKCNRVPLNPPGDASWSEKMEPGWPAGVGVQMRHMEAHSPPWYWNDSRREKKLRVPTLGAEWIVTWSAGLSPDNGLCEGKEWVGCGVRGGSSPGKLFFIKEAVRKIQLTRGHLGFYTLIPPRTHFSRRVKYLLTVLYELINCY